jgi:predicted nucleic acid binding AN1-type Zn finger protein
MNHCDFAGERELWNQNGNEQKQYRLYTHGETDVKK